jgi:plasmid maintenance system antidote protein VapI
MTNHRLSPEQLRAALKTLDLTQAEFARLIGRTARSINRWIVGDRAIPPEAAILVGLMLTGTIDHTDIKATSLPRLGASGAE